MVSDPASAVEYPPSTFFLGYRGSIAHGCFVPKNDPNSIDDIDLMGFVFGEPRHYFGLHEWGSRGTKEIKQGQYDVVLYEARKAVSLLLQGNPNIMSDALAAAKTPIDPDEGVGATAGIEVTLHWKACL